MSNKIKVLFLIHDLSFGGAEKVLVNLTNNMDKSKFDVTVQTLFDVGVNKDNLFTSVTYVPGFKYMFRGNSHLMKLFSPKFLYRFIIKKNYDIIVSYLEGPCARIISGCNMENVKKICWIHIQLDDLKRYAQGFRNLKEANECYSSFDKIICVSNTVKESFMKISNNIDNPIDVLYNTNETDEIRTKSKEMVDDVIFDKEVVNVVSVAKITEAKGIDHLAHVHKRLIDENLPHHVYILGVGEQREKIEYYLRKNNLLDTFTFLGFRKNPYKYIANCDLYICSSHREGFSTAVTESLIVGTPVVSTLCSGAQELLGYNNEYGIVVENSEEGIYNGLKYMLLNPDGLVKYKKLAKERGYYFSKENTVRAVEEMFINVLKGY